MIVVAKHVYDGRVLNMKTNDYVYFSHNLHPKQAVIAAYAQDKGDWNTWDYAKYDSLVRETLNCYACGDFSAFKETGNE